MNKKIIIGASIISTLIIFAGIYYFFFLPKNTTHNQTPTSNPFGSGGNSAPLQKGGTVNQRSITNDVSNTIETKKSGLRKISSTPVSDSNFVLTNSTTSIPIIRFIERATGHIFEANLATNINTRITNSTIPKIESVIWAIPGKTFLVQYTSETSITDTIIDLGSNATNTKKSIDQNNVGSNIFTGITKFELPQNIISATFNQNGSSFFYLLKGSQGTEGYLSTNKGVNSSLIWQFPTTEWVSQWNGAQSIALTTKASNGEPGVLYNLDVKSKKLNLLLADKPGLLTNTSQTGNKVLFTTIQNNTWETSLDDLKNHIISVLPFIALPEKCVWTKNELVLYCARPAAVSANAPDDWYQGLVSFTDTLWKFDVQTSELTQVSDLKPDDNTSIDLINPHLSQNEDYLVFMNKNDLSLWAVPTK